MNRRFDLLEFLQYVIGCAYMSDLLIEPHNTKAKIILDRLELDYYTFYEISDCIQYLYETNVIPKGR